MTRIHRPGDSLTTRVPALPLRLSRHHAYEPVRLGIAPRDCALATQWTPSAQPFTVTWENGVGEVHAEPGGDHDGALEVTLIRLLFEACGRPPRRHGPAPR